MGDRSRVFQDGPRPMTWLAVSITLALAIPALYAPSAFQAAVFRFVNPDLRLFGAAFTIFGLLTIPPLLRMAMPAWLQVVNRLALLVTLLLWTWEVAFLPGVVTGKVFYTALVLGFLLAWVRPAWEPLLLHLTVSAILLGMGGLMWLRPGLFPAETYGPLPPALPLTMVAGGLLLLPVYSLPGRLVQSIRRAAADVPVLWLAVLWAERHNWLGAALYATLGLFLLVHTASLWYPWRPALSSLRQRVMGLVIAACVLPLFLLGAIAVNRVAQIDRSESMADSRAAVARALDRIDSLPQASALSLTDLNAAVRVDDPQVQIDVVPLNSLPAAWPNLNNASLEDRWPSGDLRILTFVRRPDLGAAVVASICAPYLYKHVESVAVMILVGILVIGVSVGSVSLYLARRVTGHLTQVRTVAVNLGQMVLGWTTPLSNGRDEAEDLAVVVDEMAQTILTNTRQIREQNVQLREQTAALERQTALLLGRERRLQALGELSQLVLEGADLSEINARALDLVAAGLNLTVEEAQVLVPNPGALPGTEGSEGRPLPNLTPEERSFLQGVAHILMTAVNRRQMEAALASARDRTIAILESITDAFFTLDRDWRFVYVNHQAEAYFRANRSNLLGRSIWDVFPQLRESLYDQYKDAMNSQTALHYEQSFVSSGLWFEANAYPSPVGLSVYFRDITERHTTEQRLREETARRSLEHRRLTAVLESMPVGVFLSDEHGRIVMANEAAEHLWGSELLVAEDQAVAKILTSVERFGPEELRIASADGEPKAVLVSAEPVRDDNGVLVNLVCAAVDITDRTRMEAELRASEQLLLQQNAILQLIARDAPLQEVLEAIIRFVEAHCDGVMAAMEMLDRGRSILRYTLAPSLPEEYRNAEPCTGVGSAAASSGTAVFRGEPVIVPDVEQEPAWAERRDLARRFGIRSCWAYPVRIAQEDIMGVLSIYACTARGPTPAEARLLVAASSLAGIAVERNRVEEARMLKLQSLIEQMGEGVLALDESGQVLVINPAAAHMLRLPADPGAIALSDTDLPPDLVELIDRAARADTYQSNRLVFRRGDRELEAYISRVEARWGPHHGAIALLHDITAEAQFRRLQESFVANVSHELRGPLTSLSAAVEAMVDGVVPADRHMGYLRRILAELGRLQRLSRDLVDLSRLDAGALELHSHPFLIATLCDSVAEKFSARCGAANVSLVVERSDLKVVADYDRVEQVVTNLLENAVKFTRPGGSIQLQSRQEGGWVRVLVADTGIGIPPEHLPYIWERFYQVDAARTLTPTRGTGLGLAIVRQLVQSMGGRVDVESEVGRGTTVSFTLPSV